MWFRGVYALKHNNNPVGRYHIAKFCVNVAEENAFISAVCGCPVGV